MRCECISLRKACELHIRNMDYANYVVWAGAKAHDSASLACYIIIQRCTELHVERIFHIICAQEWKRMICSYNSIFLKWFRPTNHSEPSIIYIYNNNKYDAYSCDKLVSILVKSCFQFKYFLFTYLL